jgi:WD40 repeat protein/tRNA A-37 threonylcarbamoyl transferase component Bud32
VPAPKPGTIVLNLPPEENAGDRIGRYKLLQKLGEGGCGVVFMAEQEEPVKRRVALKVIKLGMDTRQVVARFEAERQALAMMDHPNIAKALDAGTTENGRPYFVMEVVRGIRITDYCDQNKLSTKERLELFTQVCSAIQHAHQKGIIHRDIKPSNILVTLHDGTPVPKVIDFGIAKATQQQLTDKTVFTEIHQFIGTPAYMSPEQAELSGLDIDTRSDVYSLGVLLYELLTGRTPFDPKELVQAGIDELRRRIREEEPPRPSTRVSTLAAGELGEVAMRRHLGGPQLIGLLRGDLDWIVMKCLEKDRTRRYETANGLAVDVKRYLAHEPVTARPPSAAYRIQKFYGRHRLGLAAAAGVLAALVLGFGFSTWSFVQERKARARAQAAERAEITLREQTEGSRQKAVAQQEIAEEQKRRAEASATEARHALYAADMNLAQQALKRNNLGRARRLVDRHRPASTNAVDLRGWEWRYLWQQCRSDSLFALTNRPTRCMSADFSHDGTFVAAGYLDGWIGLWNVVERRLVHVVQTKSSVAFVTFSPVAPILFTSALPGSARLFDVSSKTEKILPMDLENSAVTGVAFSADGTRVAALGTMDQDQGRLRVWEVSTGKVLHTVDLPIRGAMHQGRLRFTADGEVVVVGGIANHFEARKVSDGSRVWTAKGGGDMGLTSIAMSPKGNVFATGHGYADDTVQIWSTNAEPVATLRGHTSWVGELDFSRDGKRLLSAAADQTLRIWDTSDWKEIAVLRGHGDEVHAGAFSPDGQFVVSGSKDGALLIWNTSASNTRKFIFNFPPETLDVRPVAGNKAVMSFVAEQPPILWNLATREPTPIKLPTTGAPESRFGPEMESHFYYYDGARWLTLYQATNLTVREIARVDGGANLSGASFWNPTGALAISLQTNRVEVMNINSSDRRRTIQTSFNETVYPWRFVNHGKHLVVITANGMISIWNVATGEKFAGLDNLQIAAARGVTDGLHTTFAFLGFDNSIQPRGVNLFLCDFTKNTVTRKSAPDTANSLAFSPDKKLLAAGSSAGRAYLFEMDRDITRTLHGHLNSVSGVAFSPDGFRLLTGCSTHEAVKLWDVATDQEVLNLEGEGSLLGNIFMSDDGNVIIAGSGDRNRRWMMWEAPSWAEINEVEAKAHAKPY